LDLSFDRLLMMMMNSHYTSYLMSTGAPFTGLRRLGINMNALSYTAKIQTAGDGTSTFHTSALPDA